MVKKSSSTTALNVQSRVWRRLLQRGPYSSYTIPEVVQLCCHPCVDQEFRAYFEPRTDRLRNLLQTHRDNFKYEPSQGMVSLSEHSVIVENCLVEFVALKLQQPSSSLDIGNGFNKYESQLPHVMICHMYLIYGGSLELFLKTHRDCFVFYENGTNVRLAEGFEERRVLASEENIKLVFFFLDFLLKVGATNGKPCPVSLMRTSCFQHIDTASRNFFEMRYGANLDMFLLLNCHYFQTTKPEGGRVYPKVAAAAQGYCMAAYLKRFLQTKNAISCSTSLALDELASEVKNSQLSEVQSFFVGQHHLKQLAAFLKRYPNIFNLTVPMRVFLRKEYRPWKDEWSADVEKRAVHYFVELLRDIGSVCPRSPICFDYIFRCVESAPPECRGYLSEVFPGLDMIDLFHLHPKTFDLSSLNCVSLKLLPMEPGTQFLATEDLANEPADHLAAQYAARLLKYAPSLSPDVLTICSKTAPHEIATYCREAASKGRLRLLLELARKLLDSEDPKSKPAINHAQTVAAETLVGSCSCDSTLASNKELHLQSKSQPSSTGSRDRLSERRNAAEAAVEVVEEGAATTCPQASESPAIQPIQQTLQGNEPVQAQPEVPQENEMTAVVQVAPLGCVCF